MTRRGHGRCAERGIPGSRMAKIDAPARRAWATRTGSHSPCNPPGPQPALPLRHDPVPLPALPIADDPRCIHRGCIARFGRGQDARNHRGCCPSWNHGPGHVGRARHVGLRRPRHDHGDGPRRRSRRDRRARRRVAPPAYGSLPRSRSRRMLAVPAVANLGPIRLTEATAVEAMAGAAEAVDPESNMPRWRRPSLLEARRIRSVSAAPSDAAADALPERQRLRQPTSASCATPSSRCSIGRTRCSALRLSDLERRRRGPDRRGVGRLHRGRSARTATRAGSIERRWARGRRNRSRITRASTPEADDALTALLTARGLI